MCQRNAAVAVAASMDSFSGPPSESRPRARKRSSEERQAKRGRLEEAQEWRAGTLAAVPAAPTRSRERDWEREGEQEGALYGAISGDSEPSHSVHVAAPHASCPSILDICTAPSGRAWLLQAPGGSTSRSSVTAVSGSMAASRSSPDSMAAPSSSSRWQPLALPDPERSNTCPNLSNSTTSTVAPEGARQLPQRSLSDTLFSLSSVPSWRAALLREGTEKAVSLPLEAGAAPRHVAELLRSAAASSAPSSATSVTSWHAGAGPHACSICGMRFPTVQALGGHRNGHRELKGVHPDLPHRSTAGKRRPRGKTSKIREKENEREREREREREVQSWGVSAGPKQDPNSGFSPSLVPVSAQSSGGEGMSTTGGAEMKHLGGSLDGLSVPFLAFHQQQHQGTVSRDGKLMSAIEPCCGQYCNFFSVPCRSTRVLSGCHGKAFPKAAPSSSPSSLPSTTTTLPSQSFLSPTSTGRGSEPPLLLTETERPVKESGSPPSAKGLSKKTWLAQEILRRLAEEQSSAAAQLEADARLPEGEALRNGRARQRVDLNLKLAL